MDLEQTSAFGWHSGSFRYIWEAKLRSADTQRSQQKNRSVESHEIVGDKGSHQIGTPQNVASGLVRAIPISQAS